MSSLAAAAPLLYVVRHGKAGARERFDGPDQLRPLSAKGFDQARWLAATVAGSQFPRPVRHVVSSPATRCLQTVQPMAAAQGVVIEEAEWLLEGANPEPAFAKLREMAQQSDPPDGSGGPIAACTHGDVIWGFLEYLARSGVDIGDHPDAPKGALWVMQLASQPDALGSVAAAELLNPDEAT